MGIGRLVPIIGLLRVKNEARWIDRVVRAIKPICAATVILDDHSTDGTPDICRRAGALVLDSQFETCDESRDKDFLLTHAYSYVPEEYSRGNPASPYWGLLIDGDEELVTSDLAKVDLLSRRMECHSFSFDILYLWDQINMVRVDGVYRNFRRPSMFRLMNKRFRFLKTPFGANFHCSSIPQEMLHGSRPSGARLLHYGYLHAEDRLRKYEWYNRMDPNNIGEDGYKHMVIGDTFPAESAFRWAGPLRLEALNV